MKENSSSTTSCETAAVRVQYWFGKDKGNLLPLVQSSSITRDFSKKHKCDPVKSPRIPSQVEHLPLQGYLSKKKRTHAKPRRVTKENFSKSLRFCVAQSQCSISQKNINNHLQTEKALCSARVAYCRLKEHFLVSKRLKSMTKQGHGSPKQHKVVPIKSSTQQDLTSNPYLQEWGKIKEERHFQIGRVIKYLSD